jgi:hypothetical protein
MIVPPSITKIVLRLITHDHVMDRGTIMCDRSWYDLYIPLKLSFNCQYLQKLPIVSMSSLKLPKNVNVPPDNKNIPHKIIKKNIYKITKNIQKNNK